MTPPSTGRAVSWPIALFLIGLVVPWIISIGSMRLSIYRLVLLVMVIPCLVMWLSGRAGRVRAADIALIFFCSWCSLSLIVVHGWSSVIEPVGIGVVETLGAYFLARCFIRNANEFHNAIFFIYKIVLVLLPFFILEFLTGYNVLRLLFSAVAPVASYPPMPARLGLTRVQSVFEHPILYGAFPASIIALCHLVLGYKQNFLSRIYRTFLLALASFISLSSGPLVAMVSQSLLLFWNGALASVKGRWTILLCFLAVLFVAIELLAKRSALTIVVSYLLFDPGSYWYRRLIWMYASDSVVQYPWFGIGLNQWARPEWMGASIDNYWLYLAVKHGLPAALLMLITFLLVILPISARTHLDDQAQEYRTGFVISLVAYFLVGWTVHFWDSAYVLFLFLLGSGMWLLDSKSMATADVGLRNVRRRVLPLMKTAYPRRSCGSPRFTKRLD